MLFVIIIDYELQLITNHIITMKKIILPILFLIGFISTSEAQQDAMFTKYMFNSLVVNPGYAGSHEFMSMRLLYRNQWWGLEGAPVTETFTIHSPYNENVGLGMSVINDVIGVHGSTKLNASYAYRLPLKKGKLSFGLQAGVRNWRLDPEKLKYRDPQSTDAAFSDIKTNQFLPMVGAGAFYYSQYFYAGLSVPDLLTSELKRNGDVDISKIPEIAKFYRHYFFTAGGAIPLDGDMLIFKPSIMLKSVALFENFSSDNDLLTKVGAPNEFDIDLSLLFFQKFWVGAGFRSAFEKFTGKSSFDSIDIWTSFYLDNGLRIGAAFDYTLTKIQTYGKGSFELMLGYDFNYDVKAMATPRYF